MEVIRTLEAIKVLNYRCTSKQIAELQHRHHEIREIERELAQILCDCGSGANYTVNEDREIVYVYPRWVRERIRVKRVWFQIYEIWWEKVAPVLFNGLKTFFGVFILFSLALSVLLLLILSTSRRGNGGLSFRHHLPIPLFWYVGNPFFGGRNRNANRNQTNGRSGNAQAYTQVATDDQRLNIRNENGENSVYSSFTDDVFAFIFGPEEGFPGPGEEQRLEKIISVIRNYAGVIPGEVLRPYQRYGLGNHKNKEDHWMPSIVSQLAGEPVASDDGKIVYRFPSLAGGSFRRSRSLCPNLFIENRWVFSNRSIKLPFTIGLANLFVLYLIWNKMRYFEDVELHDTSLTSLLIALYRILKLPLHIYAIMFLLVPAIRLVVLVKAANYFVEIRNRKRREIVSEIEIASRIDDSELSQKLKFAEKLAQIQQAV